MSCSADSAMRAASWSGNVDLACKLQQTQNVNPQPGHEMPVPSGDIHHNAPRCHGAAQKRSDACNEQCEDATHQVNGMRPGQEINERAAGRGGYIEAVRG